MVDANPISSLLIELGKENTKVEGQISQFREYLLEVNRKINLISRVNSTEVVDDLIFDSLSMLRHIQYPNGARLLDFGSGAGFPWVIHKIVVPKLEIVSIDSNRRKIEFQRNAARALGFDACQYHAARVEDVNRLDVEFAIAKAFGSVELIAELARPHLQPGGRLLLPRIGDEGSIETPAGFAPANSHGYVSSVKGRLSNLIIFTKI